MLVVGRTAQISHSPSGQFLEVDWRVDGSHHLRNSSSWRSGKDRVAALLSVCAKQSKVLGYLATCPLQLIASEDGQTTTSTEYLPSQRHVLWNTAGTTINYLFELDSSKGKSNSHEVMFPRLAVVFPLVHNRIAFAVSVGGGKRRGVSPT